VALVSDQLGRFLGWWGEELRDCVPASIRRFFVPSRRRLALAFIDGEVQIIAERSRDRGKVLMTIPRSDDVARRLADFLKSFGPRKRAVPVGLRIPLTWCLERRLDIPFAARANAARILSNDLTRSTPFRSEWVRSATYLGTRSPDGKHITVHQVVVTAERLDPLREIAEDAGLEVAFVDVFAHEPTKPLPIDLLANSDVTRGRGSRHGQWAAMMVAILLAGATFTASTILDRQAAALAKLERMTDIVKVKALEVRRQLDDIETAQRRRLTLAARKFSMPSILRIWAETTQVLPDSAWLESLRVEGDQVDIAGYAESAAELIATIEHAPLFEDTQLSSPVMREERLAAERFGARFKIVVRHEGQAAAPNQIAGP
jgi:general secretion pathway protein L